MAKLSPIVLIPPLVFAALAGVFFWGVRRDNPEALPSTLIGQQAPPVPTTTLSGKTQLTDADLRSGNVTLVNFWASWCPPCRAEHPTLKALSDEGIRVVGIDLRDPPANALAFLNEHGDPFSKLATDPKGRAAIDWGVTAPPETFILDRQGRVLFRYAGPLVDDDYSQRFRPALEKALKGQAGN